MALDKYQLMDAKTFTFATTGTVADDDAVTLAADSTVGRGAAEDLPFGKVWRVEASGNANVQYDGIMVFNYTGTLSVGFGELVVDGAGAVKAPATAGTGRAAIILEVDATNSKVAAILL